MSLLRKQLQAAQLAYQQERYPGDLAAETLRPRRSLRLAAWIAPLAFAAAVILVVMWLNEPTSQAPPGGSDSFASVAGEDLAVHALQEVPNITQIDMTDMTNMAPSLGEISAPEMPEMPGFDFLETSTSQEEV